MKKIDNKYTTTLLFIGASFLNKIDSKYAHTVRYVDSLPGCYAFRQIFIMYSFYERNQREVIIFLDIGHV